MQVEGLSVWILQSLHESLFLKTKSIENAFQVLCVSSIVPIYSDQSFQEYNLESNIFWHFYIYYTGKFSLVHL